MRILSAPITVHVEMTEACNERCRHCYNFYREDGFKPQSIAWDDLDNTIDELTKNKVMHVIITGGEPLLEVAKTVYLIRRCIDAGMSVSLNSNLTLADHDNMFILREAGLDHCLTTLHHYKQDIHDKVTNTKGAFTKTVRGIKIAHDSLIRVTVNTILLECNKRDIFKIGRFVQSLGVRKFLANRCIPSDGDFVVGMQEARKMFSDLLRLREEGLEVGTCRMVPECFFANLEGCDEFVNRGCSAGKRHMMLTVDGESHACVHEETSYGNIHQIGLKSCWESMSDWRDYIPEDCKSCIRLETCEGGCRMVGLFHTGRMDGKDNLCEGNPYSPNGHKQINLREEDGFYILRERGAKVTYVDKPSRNPS